MTYLIGQQIKQYAVEALLGEGGMGVIYRALDLEKGETVALKVMHAQLARQARFQQRFLQEANATKNFDHPSIIKTYDSGQENEHLYIAMEYIQGGNLSNYIKQLQWQQKTRLGFDEITSLASEIADALNYAHRHGVIHRDIKPDNILLRSKGGKRQAVVTDFGLAMLLQEGAEEMTNPFMGSLPYMSPEQCKGEPVDGRSDIYSFGIMLYQLATGKLPFEIKSPSDLTNKHIYEIPPSPMNVTPDVPAALDALIMKAIAKKPEDRFQTGAEIGQSLQQIALPTPSVAAQAVPQTAVLTPAFDTLDSELPPSELVGSITQLEEPQWVAGLVLPSRIDVEQTWLGGDYRLLIAHKWKKSFAQPLEKNIITIGRNPDNDLVFPEETISRYHARLEKTPSGWNVIDLDSSNGVYFGKNRINCDVPETWHRSQILRIGPYFLQWQPFAEHQQMLEAQMGGTAVSTTSSSSGMNISPFIAGAVVGGAASFAMSSLDTSSSGQLSAKSFSSDELDVTIAPDKIETAPGQETEMQIGLFNHGTTVDHFHIALTGIPANWVEMERNALQLLPGERGSIRVLIKPPSDSTASSGEHPYQLQVSSLLTGQQVAVLSRFLTIGQFESFSIDMQPKTIRGKGTSRIFIFNEGNASVTYTVVGRDPGEEIRFYEPETRIAVGPGQRQVVDLNISPKKRHWYGRSKTLPFETKVGTNPNNQQTATGQLEVTPIIPIWLPVVLMLLCAGLLFAGNYAYTSIQAAKADAALSQEQAQAAQAAATASAGQVVTAEAQAANAAKDVLNAREQATASAEGAIATLAAADEGSKEEIAAAATQAASDAIATVSAAQSGAADAAGAAAAAATAAANGGTPAAGDAPTATPQPTATSTSGGGGGGESPTAAANSAPMDIVLDNATVPEDVPVGSVVGSFTSIDANTADEHTYSLVSSSSSNDNASFTIQGADLVTAALLDYEIKSSMTIFVQSDDGNGGSFVKRFTITVADIEDTPVLSIQDISLSETKTTASLTVVMEGVSGQDVTVGYRTVDGTATAGTDYTASANGLLTWAVGETGEKTINLSLTDDKIHEGDETFSVELFNVKNADLDSSAKTAVVTVEDDDPVPTLITIESVNIDEQKGPAVVVVKMTGISSEDVTVNYATSDGTATVGSDYLIGSGVLTWNAGETGDKTFNLVITNDNLDEPKETININLTNPTNATIDNGAAVISIIDDDATPDISIADTAVLEDAGTATLVLTLKNQSALPVSVTYATSDVTAKAPGDYTAANTAITWLPGETGTKSFTLNVTNDVIDEPNETLEIKLSNVANATIADALAVVTITDNDDAPQLTITDVTVAEAAPNVTLEVTMIGGSSQDVTVSYATLNDTATAPGDYTAVTNGTLTWAADEVGKKSFLITLAPDLIDEPDEAFKVVLSNPVNAFLGDDGIAIVTVTDDDPSPGITITDLTLSENQGPALVKVTLIGANSLGVTVSYGTNEDTAQTGIDYTESASTITWAPDESGDKIISIPLNDDNIDEVQEQFFVNLSNANHATINDAQGIVKINDNDLPPTLAVADTSITEASGTIDVVVTLTRASGNGVTVNFATQDDTAVAPGDYTAQSGQLSWDPDETGTKTVTIPIMTDVIDEQNEKFKLVISSPTGATITDNVGEVTITDSNDSPPISIADVTLNENVGTAQIQVNLTGGSSPNPVTVNYSTQSGTAVGGSDYIIPTPGTLTWLPNETGVKTFNVTILDDTIFEGTVAEYFTVTLSSPSSNATISDGTARISISENEPQPTISVQTASANEVAGQVSVPVSLNGTSSTPITVQFDTANGTAVAPGDYTSVANQTITWLPGETGVKNVVVPLIDDNINEPDETFKANITNPTQAVILNATANITIVSDDAKPTITIADIAFTEDLDAVVTLTLTGASSLGVTVDYATSDGTATGGDYTSGNGSVSWLPDQSGTKTINVPITEDTIKELNETFDVVLSNPTNTQTILDPIGTVTITDNDVDPQLSINNATVNETDGTATLTVTLTGAHYLGSTVTVATSNGTAVSTEDYVALPGTVLTWLPDQSGPKTIDVTLTNDTVYELTELFHVDLSLATNSTITDAQGDVTITSDDSPPTIAVLDNAVTEGGAVGVIVRVTGTSSQPMSVNYVTADGTATVAGSDYIPQASQTFNWAAYDSTDRLAVVSTNQDVIYEQPSENFKVNLATPVGATISDNTANITITDDDTVPTLGIADLTVIEDDNAGTNAVVAVTLSGASSLGVTVRFDTSTSGSPNPATAGASGDYISQTNQTLTWLPDETGVKNITITINEDNIDEPDQPFNIDLSNATNATITDNQGVVTIQDNDSAPTLTIADIGTNESSGSYSYQVLMTGASHWGEDVNCSTVVGGTATAGTDYTTVTNFNLHWNANVGDVTRNCVIPILQDTLDEDNETVQVDLSGSTFATIVDGTGILTINDDDALPVISIAGVTVNEEDGFANVTVTLTPVSGRTVTVPYATTNGTASAGSDYTTSSGTVTWTAGQTSQTISVPILESHSYEGDETFTVALGAPTNANSSIPTSPATVTIKDDKDKPTIFAQNTVVNEDVAAGTVTVNLIIVGDRDIPITVNYTTANGTATTGGGGDYTLTAGSKTFAAGLSGTPSQSFTVPLNNSGGGESTEYFTIDLTTTSSPANAANLVDGTVTIIDEDNGGGGSLNGLETLYYVQDQWFDECSPTSDVNLLIVNPATANSTTVTYNTSSGGAATATTPGDYTAVPSTVWTHAIADLNVFAVPITVAQDADPTDLHVEMFFINLSAPGPVNGGLNGKDPQVPPSPLTDQGRVFILNCYP